MVAVALILAATGAYFIARDAGPASATAADEAQAAASGPAAPSGAVPAPESTTAGPDGSPVTLPAPAPIKDNPKLQSSLNRLVSVNESSGAGAAAAFAAQQGLSLTDGKVTVVMESSPGESDRAKALAVAAGGSVQATHASLVQVSIPVDKLKQLTGSGAVAFVRPPEKPQLFTVTSEGVADIGANTWQAAGISGAGTKIAILDPGFSGYSQMIASGELPANVITQSFRADGDITGGGQVHGTACAEIVHDVAPGAQLYLVNFNTDVELANAINWLISQHVDVISASWGFFGDFRGDGQGSIDNLAQQANAAGIFWANAAGNSAQTHWSGAFSDPDGNGWTDFVPGDESNSIQASAGEEIDVFLTWNKWPVTDQDYDVYLFYWNGSTSTQVAAGDSPQTGTQPPSESMTYVVPQGQSGTYYVGIRKYAATGDAVFQLYIYPYTLEHYVTASSLGGQPSDSPYAMTAGAVAVNTNTLEYFSSQGPTLDGRVKPDIVAPDRVSTATYGPGGFWGTSAAAPHLAGAAALVKAGHPTDSPADIQSYLESQAADLGAAGKDNLYGSGKLRLFDTTAPQITGVRPSGSISTTSATVAVYYYDSGIGVNTGAVNVTVDGTTLAGCTVTATAASCPAANLGPGTHVIGGTVADNAGNTATISGSFSVSCTQPLLSLNAPQSFWASYADYLNGDLSVSMTLCNTGSTTATNVQIIGSINSNGVTLTTPLNIFLGDIPSGGCASTTVEYRVPQSISMFHSIIYVVASDSCGAVYSFPGPYPGA